MHKSCVLVLLSLVICVLAKQPNIIFILTDDQDLLLGSVDYMPLLQKQLIKQGMTFGNHYVTDPLCCPSRASILRGQFPHNTQIIDLFEPGGGALKFRWTHLEDSTAGTWMKSAGYATAFMGKYMNQYPCNLEGFSLANPPGWEEWFTLCDEGAYNYYNSTYSHNGNFTYFAGEYQTDTLRDHALRFIHQKAKTEQPFFLYLGGVAPHEPATPAIRHQNMFDGVKAPRKPSFNQKDISKDPGFYGTTPLLNHEKIKLSDQLYRDRLRTLQAVDEMVDAVVNQVVQLGLMDNTYIFFTTDNGFHIGEHRFRLGKRTPYEEDVLVPMYVRGPGIKPGVTVKSITSHVDLAATWIDIASAQAKNELDGKSLLPIMTMKNLTDPHPFVLVEHYGKLGPPTSLDDRGLNNTWQQLRIINETHNWAYTSHCFGGFRFNDMKTDPYQINNTYDELTDTQKRELDAWLRGMFFCKGDTCRNPKQDFKDVLKPLTECFINNSPPELLDYIPFYD